MNLKKAGEGIIISMTDLQILKWIQHKFKTGLHYIPICVENDDKIAKTYFQGYCDACFELYHLIKNQIDKEISEMEKQENDSRKNP